MFAFLKRTTLTVLFLGTGFASFPSEVAAGCLCDWLLGRQTAYYAPAYVAGYSPVPAPVASYRLAPVSSFYGTGNVYPSFPGSSAIPASIPSSGYAAYAYPTAYSPAGSAYTYSAPASNLYGVAPVSGYGTAPVSAYSLPLNNSYGVAPVSAYSVAPALANSYGYPTTAYMPTLPAANAYPVIPAYRPGGLFDGLRRMFRPVWPWGSGYTTNYYPAQVTYYAPATTAYNPAIGPPVTNLSACTSYQMQVQRLPSTSLLPNLAAPAASDCGTNPGCSSGDIGYGGYPTTPVYPNSTYPPAAGYTAPNPGSSVNAQPYTGSGGVYPEQPATSLPSLGPGSPSDLSPVPQPAIPSNTNFYGGSSPSLSPSSSPAASSYGAQPIPAPALPSWYSQPSSSEQSNDLVKKTYKTIQWTTKSSPANTPTRSRPVIKFDDSGWK